MISVQNAPVDYSLYQDILHVRVGPCCLLLRYVLEDRSRQGIPFHPSVLSVPNDIGVNEIKRNYNQPVGQGVHDDHHPQ